MVSSYRLRSLYLYDADNWLISRYLSASVSYIPYSSDQYEKNYVQAVREYIDSDADGLLITSYYDERQKRDILRLVMKTFVDNGRTCTGYKICDFFIKFYKTDHGQIGPKASGCY